MTRMIYSSLQPWLVHGMFCGIGFTTLIWVAFAVRVTRFLLYSADVFVQCLFMVSCCCCVVVVGARVAMMNRPCTNVVSHFRQDVLISLSVGMALELPVKNVHALLGARSHCQSARSISNRSSL